MLSIKSLYLKNFLSYEEETLDFNFTGPVVILGNNKSPDPATSNGSGKTALLDAIVYAFFGRTSRGVATEAVIRTGARKKGCCVKLVGTYKGVPFRIERYRNDKKLGNGIFLFVNGVPIGTKTMVDTQEKINQMFNLDYNVFMNVCFFSAYDHQPFPQLSDTAKRQILEHILRLGKYDVAYSMAKEELGVLEREKQQRFASYVTLRDKKTSLVKNLLSELEKNKALRQKNKELASTLEASVDSLQKEVDDLLEDRKEKASVLDSLLVAMKDVAAVEQKIVQFTDVAKKLSGMSNTRCPTCYQDVGEEHTRVIADKALERAEELNGKRVELSAALEQIEPIRKSIEEIDTEVADLRTRIASTKRTITELTKADASPVVEKLREILNEIDDEKGALRKTIGELHTKIDIMTAVSELFSKKGVRNFILKEALEVLNTCVDSYIYSIYGGKISIDIKASYTARAKAREVDKISIAIKKDGKETTYENLSSGEARRVDLAFIFGIIDFAKQFGFDYNLVVLDETFRNLDEKGTEMVISAIKSIEHNNMFIVSHDPFVKQYFNNIIQVTKTDVSKIQVFT